MVDPCTKEEHEQTNEQMTSLKLLNRDKTPTSQELVELIDSTISLAEPQDTTISIDIHSDNDTYEEQKYIFLPRKKKAKLGTFCRITEVELVAEDSSYNMPAEYDTDNIYTSESSIQEDSPNDEDNDFSDNFENYSHPMFNIPDISDIPDISELPTDELIKRILIWIIKFRSSHNIPNTAIEELIQFIKIIFENKADAHLGLMMNLDWFQPYKRTIYSTGVIYVVICNLPRDVRFKPKNVFILGILPGPDEVKLHKVNHYLLPIITKLQSLWEGVNLNHTNECPNGKDI
ncbi:hypothetical protein RclHR1_17840002 [Rhizophagus clarus]|uniref:Uncharacterized protein n=1 Tax=Rhizophagus clarus TaxID=94130 RepID=A0A2Z6QMG9_9GLOM|nr:hypothetical protein RclHR1_17840002 [Rhizophagus clarus]